MRALQIEEILAKHGVQQSKELSLALEEILTVYSKDKDLAKNVSENIQKETKLKNLVHGIK